VNRHGTTANEKIAFGEMRASGVRRILVHCADYKRSHSVSLDADMCPDHLRLSDIEERFTYQTCGKRGADVRPHFQRQNGHRLGVSHGMRRTSVARSRFGQRDLWAGQ
jgi:hypothetical protein